MWQERFGYWLRSGTSRERERERKREREKKKKQIKGVGENKLQIPNAMASVLRRFSLALNYINM